MSRTFGCHEAVHRLWDYLDGEVSGDDLADLERHLAFCLRCCGELAFARELRARLRRTDPRTVPADALTRLTDFVETLDLSGEEAHHHDQ